MLRNDCSAFPSLSPLLYLGKSDISGMASPRVGWEAKHPPFLNYWDSSNRPVGAATPTGHFYLLKSASMNASIFPSCKVKSLLSMRLAESANERSFAT